MKGWIRTSMCKTFNTCVIHWRRSKAYLSRARYETTSLWRARGSRSKSHILNTEHTKHVDSDRAFEVSNWFPSYSNQRCTWNCKDRHNEPITTFSVRQVVVPCFELGYIQEWITLTPRSRVCSVHVFRNVSPWQIPVVCWPKYILSRLIISDENVKFGAFYLVRKCKDWQYQCRSWYTVLE